jgi:hypothetical protein
MPSAKEESIETGVKRSILHTLDYEKNNEIAIRRNISY